MLKQHLVLGSVAGLALAVAASPAFAQSPPQYPNYSLPWELAQTQQLNAQQASEPGVTISTPEATAAVVTPDTTAVVASSDNSADVVAYDQALAANDQRLQAQQSQFSSEQSSYNDQLGDYQAKQGAYQQAWQDYQDKLGQYNARVAAGETIVTSPVIQDQWVTIYPRGYQRLVIVDTRADVTLRGVPVMDAIGNVVGNFRHMSLRDGGIPEAIITLNDQKTVAIGDQHLRFDPTAKVIVADLTYNQMEHMPRV